MANEDSVFAGSVPAIYDRLLVPLIFEPYAQDLVDRAMSFHPADILEIAAGTGVVTRILAAHCPEARIVANDLNMAMLEVARTRQPASDTVTWKQADAVSLPFPDHDFDLVLCQFGAMFFPEKPAAYAEARRVLRPGGAFIFNLWGPIENNGFANTVTQALGERYPDDPPLFLARTPHGHADPGRVRADLSQAGYGDIRIDTIRHVSRAPSPREVAVAMCQGTPLRGEIELREPAGLEAATDAATGLLRARYGDGPIEAPIEALVVTARP